MILLELFLGFLYVGCFSFGGAYSAIPLIREVVVSGGWISDEALSYMIAVSESTPGPIMVNLATYVGSSQAGILGSAVATFAVILPAFFIILLVMIALSKVLEHRYTQAVLDGLKPCITGIILAIGAYMLLENLVHLTGGFSVNIRAVITALLLVAALVISKKVFKKKMSPIMLICISAVVGIIVYAI